MGGCVQEGGERAYGCTIWCDVWCVCVDGGVGVVLADRIGAGCSDGLMVPDLLRVMGEPLDEAERRRSAAAIWAAGVVASWRW